MKNSSIGLVAFVALTWATLQPAWAQDMPLHDLLIPGEGWSLVAEGFKFTEGPAADDQGNLFFTDIPNNKIHKVDAQGKVSVFVENSQGANGLMIGPEGKLFACQNSSKKIVAFDTEGNVQTIAENVASNDLVVLRRGDIYFTDPPGGKVWFIPLRGKPSVVADGLKPNGIIMWADQSTLVVTDRDEPHLWTFRMEADGKLSNKERYYMPLQLASGTERPGSDGMTIDQAGRLYVATRAGIQVFDPTGRPSGTILKPQNGPLSNVTFGGRDLQYLYSTTGDKVFRRKVNAKGVLYFLPSKQP